MADQDGPKDVTPEKPRPMPPSRKGIAPANAWPKGVSGNPRGRPRAGTALAERVRERISPDTVIDLVAEIIEDKAIPSERRLAALLQVTDRGFTKPAVDAKLTVTPGAPQAITARLAAKLSTETIRELVEAHERAQLEAGEPDACADAVPDTPDAAP